MSKSKRSEAPTPLAPTPLHEMTRQTVITEHNLPNYITLSREDNSRRGRVMFGHVLVYRAAVALRKDFVAKDYATEVALSEAYISLFRTLSRAIDLGIMPTAQRNDMRARWTAMLSKRGKRVTAALKNLESATTEEHWAALDVALGLVDPPKDESQSKSDSESKSDSDSDSDSESEGEGESKRPATPDEILASLDNHVSALLSGWESLTVRQRETLDEILTSAQTRMRILSDADAA